MLDQHGDEITLSLDWNARLALEYYFVSLQQEKET